MVVVCMILTSMCSYAWIPQCGIFGLFPMYPLVIPWWRHHVHDVIMRCHHMHDVMVCTVTILRWILHIDICHDIRTIHTFFSCQCPSCFLTRWSSKVSSVCSGIIIANYFLAWPKHNIVASLAKPTHIAVILVYKWSIQGTVGYEGHVLEIRSENHYEFHWLWKKSDMRDKTVWSLSVACLQCLLHTSR